MNRVRIIGGQWRSRSIIFDDVPGLRPTPSRVRETLFNWLRVDIANSRCLDLFAGSGALGFEAASRGACRVVQIENNPLVWRKLQQNAGRLAADRITAINADAIAFLQKPAVECYDVVFVDPPFGQNRVEQVCRILESRGWLAAGAKIYIEAERECVLADIPPCWRLLKNKTAGAVAYYLFQRLDSA